MAASGDKPQGSWFMDPPDFWIPLYAVSVVAMFLLAGMLAAIYQGAC